MSSFVKISVVLVLGFAGYWFATQLLAPSSDYQRIEWQQNCRLNESVCTYDLPNGGSISLSINSGDIVLMKPLALLVTGNEIALSGASIDIVGLNMEMGINRTQLTYQPASGWVGETILPICSQRRMEWEARVFLKTKQGDFLIPFHFLTQG